jgi:arabinose-5-phosphate isomerase
MDHLEYARSTVQQQIEALQIVRDQLGQEFVRAVDALFHCTGRVIVSGVGKAGIIGRKISATLASTGTASYWMHAVEARHGDLGRVVPDDVVLALSNSGETEVVQLVPSIKKLNATIVAITGNAESTLARYSDIVLDIGRIREACPLGLAPSCSTTAMLVMGDALALTIFRMRNWQPEDYAFYHPGGELGRKLIRVHEVMRTGEANPVVPQQTPVRQALGTMSGPNSPGAASVVDEEGRLVGFFTDGDLRRRLIEGDAALLDSPVREVMTRGPKTIGTNDLAAEAFRMLRQYRIDQVPVVDDEERPVGLLDVQDWLDIERGSDHLDPPENER